MCHVIVTCRSMLWTLLSIVVAFAELIAFMSPDWLLGSPRSDSSVSKEGVDSGKYRPSLGLYSRCLHIGTWGRGVSCGPYANSFGEVASGFWQAAMLFLAAGTLVLGVVACMSIFTLCFQSILKKSIFNVCGLLQAIAGERWICVCVDDGKRSHVSRSFQTNCSVVTCHWTISSVYSLKDIFRHFAFCFAFDTLI